MTALAVAAVVPIAGALLFLVLPRMERWLDEEEVETTRGDVRAAASRDRD
jgi:hypothetical protein